MKKEAQISRSPLQRTQVVKAKAWNFILSFSFPGKVRRKHMFLNLGLSVQQN
jgi:hypothetical protein